MSGFFCLLTGKLSKPTRCPTCGLLTGSYFFCTLSPFAVDLVWVQVVSIGEMEGCEGVKVVELGESEMEGVVGACERVFRVGELVEFWVGPVGRAYLTDSVAPAYVKEIHGLGWYGIKMVGSFGGGNRRVHRESLFKDSTFSKQVLRLEGARVRTKTRMQERAQDEAEAKMGDELRETRRKLQR